MTIAQFWKPVLAFFRIGLAFVAIWTTVLAVWDTTDPWPISNEAKLAYENDYFFVPIGGSWRGGQRLAQTALLFPNTVNSPKFISIRRSNDGLTIHLDQHRFWLGLLYIGAGWYFVFWYARRWVVGKEKD